MFDGDCIIIGGTGLIGSEVKRRLEASGRTVLSLDSSNYAQWKGARATTLINCNGNSYRYRANQDPKWDFMASVTSVSASLFDFGCDLYIYMSTVDVYNDIGNSRLTEERVAIAPESLMPYAFHKWLAERQVERYASHSVIFRLATVLGPLLKKNPLYDAIHDKPLHMSPESELNFIDAGTIAQCVEKMLMLHPHKEIFNVAASESFKLADLEQVFSLRLLLEPGEALTKYRYDINNCKISQISPMPTSYQVVSNFLASHQTPLNP